MSDWLEIHALADGHLEGEAKTAAEQKLAQNEQLQAEYEAVKVLRDTLATKCPTLTCEDTLRKTKQRLVEIDRAKRVDGFVGRYSWALCGVFFMAILGAATLNRMSGSQLDPADVARVSSSMSPITLPGNTSVDARSKWVDDLFGQPAPVRPTNLQFSSVARGQIQGYSTFRFDMLDGKPGSLALFVIAGNPVIGDPTGQQQPGKYAPIRVQTTNGLYWREGNFSIMLLGDRSTDELVSTADLIRIN